MPRLTALKKNPNGMDLLALALSALRDFGFAELLSPLGLRDDAIESLFDGR